MLVEEGGDDIPKPGDRASAYDPDYTNYDKHRVVICNALDDSVDSPDNVKEGKAKNNLYYPREIVKGFDKIFHFVSPNVCFGFSTTISISYGAA